MLRYSIVASFSCTQAPTSNRMYMTETKEDFRAWVQASFISCKVEFMG